jgi:hypothetical protein
MGVTQIFSGGHASWQEDSHDITSQRGVHLGLDERKL